MFLFFFKDTSCSADLKPFDKVHTFLHLMLSALFIQTLAHISDDLPRKK